MACDCNTGLIDAGAAAPRKLMSSVYCSCQRRIVLRDVVTVQVVVFLLPRCSGAKLSVLAQRGVGWGLIPRSSSRRSRREESFFAGYVWVTRTAHTDTCFEGRRGRCALDVTNLLQSPTYCWHAGNIPESAESISTHSPNGHTQTPPWRRLALVQNEQHFCLHP